jgi:uncharacterized protein YaaN involved in tellurite resistance
MTEDKLLRVSVVFKKRQKFEKYMEKIENNLKEGEKIIKKYNIINGFVADLYESSISTLREVYKEIIAIENVTYKID